MEYLFLQTLYRKVEKTMKITFFPEPSAEPKAGIFLGGDIPPPYEFLSLFIS